MKRSKANFFILIIALFIAAPIFYYFTGIFDFKEAHFCGRPPDAQIYPSCSIYKLSYTISWLLSLVFGYFGFESFRLHRNNIKPKGFLKNFSLLFICGFFLFFPLLHLASNGTIGDKTNPAIFNNLIYGHKPESK
jgi:hypothetical protein